MPSTSCALIGIIQVELRIDHTVIKKHSDRVAEIINLVSPGHFCSRAAIACHHGRQQLRGISVTRSLRASKPISSLPEFEGTLALTRLLTRRLHVSSLSVCRHCVAHLASLFIVKPHGPGWLKTEASSRPGFIDPHLAHSTSSPPSIPTSLSHRSFVPFFVHCSSIGSFRLQRTLTDRKPLRVCGRVRVLDHAKEEFFVYSFQRE